MASDRRRTCRVCLRHDSECGPISWRGKCDYCGGALMKQAARELRDHNGPAFQRWREGMAASVGAHLPERP